MTKVLIYLGKEQGFQPAYAKLLQTLELPCRFITDTQTGATLNELFEERETLGSPHALSHPLMVMKEVSDAQFSSLMQVLKNAGMVMERKAMWTIHNQDWSLIQLAAEIEEEHRYFADQKTLYDLFAQSNELTPESYTQESWNAYAQVMLELYAQARDRQPAQAELTAMIEKAKQAKDQLVSR